MENNPRLDCQVLLDSFPDSLSRPVLSRIPDEVVDGVFDVVIRIQILGVPFYDFALDQFD